MHRMTALRSSAHLDQRNDEFRVAEDAPTFEKRHFTHKRMERWIRLQQFVFGLPDDYAYAICTTAQKNGKFHTRTLVKVGWMSWYGDGRGADRQHSLAVSLLDTQEALSANSSTVFWHTLSKWVSQGFGRRRRKEQAYTAAPSAAMSPEEKQLELMAG
jgi:hypothetical protein